MNPTYPIVALVLGRQAKGRRNAQAHKQLGGQLPGHISVGHSRPVTRVATIAAATKKRPGRTIVIELVARFDAGNTRRQLNARQLRHPGRIEKHRAGIVGNRRRTGIGRPQATGVLLPELEGSGRCGAGKDGQQQGGQGAQCQCFHCFVLKKGGQIH